jgi:CPA2 family monovalent cation:H+ antiporter-2
LNATRQFLYPVAVAVSAITTLTTPFLIRAADPVANLVDRKLPKPLQTFAALYGSWVESLRAAPPRQTAGARIRRLVRLLLLDAALLAALIIGMSLSLERIAAAIESRFGLSASVAHLLGLGLGVLLAVPFCVGVVRLARALGVLLAEKAFSPVPAEGRLDRAAAPRRALVMTLQLTSILLVGAPLVALTQPFLPGFLGAVALLLLLLVLGVGFWRSTTNLQGHVRAGTQVIVEALAAQSRGKSEEAHAETLEKVHPILPGLGEPTPVQLAASSPAVGRTLAELNLRGMTGATVLALKRGEGGAIIPTAHEPLRAGDVLALAGTHDAIDAARAVLEGST